MLHHSTQTLLINYRTIDRRESLELILPKAQQFQEEVDTLQQWFISVEQTLAELRNAERVMLHLSDATDKAKVSDLQCTIISHNAVIQLPISGNFANCPT